VFGLLELDPSRRLTAQQALQHPFILQLSTAHTEMKPSPRRSSVLDKLKRTVTVIRGYQVRACARGCPQSRC
jgi:serine/threonine protein kinase